MSSSNKRRNFLKLILTGGAVAITAPVTGQSVSGNSEENSEKIKMLTEDGRLVEIDKKMFEQISKGKKAANDEIRDFIKSPKKDGHE